MAYATVANLKAHIDKTTAGDDVILAAILDAATANIDRAVGRYKPGFEFYNAPVVASARIFPGSGLAWQTVDECVAITLVAVKDSVSDTTYTTWIATDWLAYSGCHTWPNFNILPYTGIMTDPNGDYSTFTFGGYGSMDYYFSGAVGLTNQRVGARLVPTVQITARWGCCEAVPPDISLACIEQAARWYKRGQSAMSDALASGELGQLLYHKALDPDIARKLVDGRHVRSVFGGH